MTTADNVRRTSGTVIGLVMGLIYGSIAATINSLVLRDIPMGLEVGSVARGVLLAAFAIAICGLVSAWPVSGIYGVGAGAICLVTFAVIEALLRPGSANSPLGSKVLVIVISIVPVLFLLLPVPALLRLGATWHAETLTEASRFRGMRLAGIWAGGVILAILVGCAALMSPDEQTAVRRINYLVQQGLNAESEQAVPEALQSVADFQSRAIPPYQLFSSGETSDGQQYFSVEVHFSSGLVFTCLTSDALPEPICRDLAPTPLENE